MGFKNSNLSFRAHPSANVLRGRALKLNNDGTVQHITSFNTPIIGWSMENVKAGQMVSVSTITEGTIYAEVSPGISIYAGEILGMADDGRVKKLETSAEYTVDFVSTATPGQVILGIPGTPLTPDYWVDFSCSITGPVGHARLGTYYTILSNTNDLVILNTVGVPDPLANWDIGMTFRMIQPMVGFSLEYVQNASVDKKYAEVLMLRQLANFDRQPY